MIWNLFADLLRPVFRTPVTQGRLELKSVDRAARPLVRLNLAIGGVGLLLALLALLLRQFFGVTISQSAINGQVSPLVQIILSLLVLSLSAAFQAVIRLPGRWKYLAAVGYVLLLATASGVATGIGIGVTQLIMIAGCSLSLLILAWVRSSRPWQWWEFPVVVVFTGAPVIFHSTSTGRDSVNAAILADGELRTTLVLLSAPIFFSAATVFAQWLSSGAVSIGRSYRSSSLSGLTHKQLRRMGIVALLIAIAARIALMFWEIPQLTHVAFISWLTAALHIVVLAIICWLIVNQTSSQSNFAPMTSATTFRWASIIATAWVGLPILVSIFIRPVLGLIFTFSQNSTVLWWLDAIDRNADSDGLLSALAAIVALLCIVAAFWLPALRGTTTAVFVASAGVFAADIALQRFVNTSFSATLGEINILTALIVIVVTIVLLIRRRLHRRSAATLLGALFLSIAFAGRSWLSGIDWWLGGVFAGLLVIGLIWYVLAAGGWTRIGSLRFSSTAKTVLFASTWSLACLTLAATALIQDHDVHFIGVTGDRIGGSALLAATFLFLMISLIRLPRTDSDQN